MTAYRIPAHVRSADCADSIVLLDLRGGDYYIIQDEAARLWLRLRQVETPAVSDERAARLAAHLARQGLLQDTPPAGRSPGTAVSRAVSVAVARLASSRPTAWLARRPPLRWLLPGAALLVSTLAIRFLPLSTVVAFLDDAARRGGARDGSRNAVPRAEIDEVVRRVCDSRVRHLLPAACLELSLAMSLVRIAERRPIVWCIGVRNPPFDAHAWVEPPVLGPSPGSVESQYQRLVRIAV